MKKPKKYRLCSTHAMALAKSSDMDVPYNIAAAEPLQANSAATAEIRSGSNIHSARVALTVCRNI